MIERARAFFSRLPIIGQITLPLALGLIASLACIGAFAALADDVIDQEDIVTFDLELANELHRQMTPELIDIYRVFSFIGMQGLLAVGVVVGIYFIVKNQRLSLMVWTAALIGGLLLNMLIKEVFARPRPVFADPIAVMNSFSFPSGHAMLSLITIGMLAYFLWSRLATSYARIFAVFFGILLILLIGISRMALGVHYLSDVIAGYAAGGVWLLSCIAAAERFERKSYARVLQRKNQKTS